MSETRYRFTPAAELGCLLDGCGTRHWHGGAFGQWFGGLTLGQQQQLRDKAKWEGMSLSAVAMEWGVPADLEVS